MPDATGYTPTPGSTTRGFTGHEMLDQVGLVHMNGRVYDPDIGRFVSPDILIQDKFNLQSWNAYSYVNNNPLSYTDPSGFAADPYQTVAEQIGYVRGSSTEIREEGTVTVTVDPETGEPQSVELNGKTQKCVSCEPVATSSDNSVSFTASTAGAAIVLGVGGGLGLSIPVGPNRSWLSPADRFSINRGSETHSYGTEDFARAAERQVAVIGAIIEGVAPSLCGTACSTLLGVGEAQIGNSTLTLDPPTIYDKYDLRTIDDFLYWAEFYAEVYTPRNGAVFWSGPGNRAAAEAFARENGKATLSMTPGGALAEKFFGEGSPLTEQEAEMVWQVLSRRFAQEASGTGVGFVEGGRSASIFELTEFPEGHYRLYKPRIGVLG